MSDNVINKVTSLEIIVRIVDGKPYYEIKYKKVGEDYYHVGYSSYYLNNVLKWYCECFELVNVEMTNADRIRSMKDEELAEFIVDLNNHCLAGIGKCNCSNESTVNCEEICSRKTLEWLQSETE